MVRDHALGLAANARFEPAVFAVGGLGVNADALVARQIPVWDCRPRGLRLRGFNHTLLARLHNFRPQILHAHSGAWYPATLAHLLLRRTRLVFTDHGRYPPEPALRRVLERVLARVTDEVVAVSPALADYDRDWLGLRTPPVVIANGLDLNVTGERRPMDRGNVRADLGAGPDDCLVVAVGRLVPVKDHRTLIEAVARCRKAGRPVRLALIGSGPLEAELRQHAATLGIADAVRFAGFRDDVPDCLCAADIWACSSTTEGLPIALLEAMAAGCPILSTAVGGIPDALGVEGAGELVPPSNSGAMAERLLYLVDNPNVRERMAGQALRRASKYSLASMVTAYEALYSRILEDCST